MVNDLSYSTVSTVVDSWETIRRLPNFRELIGKNLFEKLFLLEPKAKEIFGFEDTDVNIDLGKNAKFASHAKYFIQMIDKALGMLGPDIELLTEIMTDLGVKHVHYGVKAEYFPSMGRALMLVLADHLGDEFTQSTKDAWVEVYGALSLDMIKAQSMFTRRGSKRIML